MDSSLRIGYARISSRKQSLTVQLSNLVQAGCDPVLSEVASGIDRSRPVFRQVIEEAREASRTTTVEVVVTRMDRWSRDVVCGRTAIERLSQSGVRVVSLTESFDSLQPAGLYTATLLMASAELDWALTRHSVIEARRVRGPSAIGGRPRSLTPANVALARRMREQEGMSANAVAAQFGVSRSTLLRALRRERLAAARLIHQPQN